jgi:beta-lactamase regulating signal transducer with metallopeptidase domain
MTLYEAPVAWCALQVAIVASLGAAATWIWSRRSPGSAATAAAGAVVTILGVTLLAPIPLPGVFDCAGLPEVEAASRTEAGDREGDFEAAERRDVGFDLGTAVARGWAGVGKWLRAKPQVAGEHGETSIRAIAGTSFAVVVALSAAAGLAHLATSWRYVARLRRRCTSVEDAATDALFRGLAERLGIRRPVILGESAALASPAAIGWRRPVVLLPAERGDWNESHLRATIAHELAHVARGDFAWRFAASLARAIHFYHPIVHVLVRRLALAQEMAADRMAAAAVGGSGAYLRAISELAIRWDDHTRLRAEPIVLPAFSSSLSRRIAMLRSKEGSAASGRPSAGGVLAAALIALAGVGLVALRGAAETTAADGAAAGPFAANRPDIAFMGPANVAMLVVQPDELARRADLAPIVQLAEALTQQQLDQTKLVDGAVMPKVRFEAVDFIAYALRYEAPKKDAGDKADNGAAPVSAPAGVDVAVRFVDKMDIQAWATDNVLDMQAINEDGFSYLLGPGEPNDNERLCLAQRDAHTLIMSNNVARLRRLATGTGLADASGAESFAAQWASVDGGLAALAINSEMAGSPISISGGEPLSEFAVGLLGVGVAPGEPNPVDTAWRTICDDTKLTCVGVDFDAATSALAVRAAMACQDYPTAKRVRASIELLQQVAQAYLKAVFADPAAAQAPDALTQMYLDAAFLGLRTFGDAKTDFRLRDDDAVDVWFEASGELPASVRQALASLAGDEGATQRRAIAETSPEDTEMDASAD